MQVHPQNTVSPQNTKGKSNMVYEEAKRNPETDKWMVSVVIEQGRLVSKLEYKMTSYDPRTFRAFFEPVKTTKPMRLYAGKSKRQRPQITSITLLEYNQGRVTAEEQISLNPLSFSVNEPGIFCLFRDKSFWHMYAQVSMEDHSHEFNRKRDPQRWLQPLGFEVEVIMDDLSDKKSPNVVVEEVTTDDDDNDKDDEPPRKRTIEENHDVVTPPPVVRSTSSFPFHNSFTLTDWCVNKQPTWRGKLKKLGCNVRNVFHRTRF
jgi:hypothetical protein